MLSTNTIVIVAKKVLKPNLNNEFYISGERIKKSIKTSFFIKNLKICQNVQNFVISKKTKLTIQ